ncbi:MAG: nucleoside 2-deoxyribosyltransferase [Promethearchaeota archaeon]
MKQVKAYLASQFGFSETGRYLLNNLIKPKIQEIGININDPFKECKKEFNDKDFSNLEKYGDRINYYNEFNSKITQINNRLMRDSDCLLAVLDGGHQIDDGVASEIGYYAGIEQGPIYALRSDFRSGENIATSINPQILGYIEQTKGVIVDTIERWFSEIQRLYDRLKEL